MAEQSSHCQHKLPPANDVVKEEGGLCKHTEYITAHTEKCRIYSKEQICFSSQLDW